MASLLYALLALLGIGFLIFIHELGHYFMARRVGITVEVFAIGFGKAIYQWEHKGVKWKLGWLPFGGYVKMAGTEKKGSIEPYQVPDGFFGKKPWDRIKVAGMGPIVNIVFAFMAFTFLWTIGGRDKPFSDYTNTIGWVEKDSGLYRTGVRSGDQVTALNGKEFKRFESLLYAAVLNKQIPEISGKKIDYYAKTTHSFQYSFETSRKLDGSQRVVQIFSSFGPASYLIYDKTPSGGEIPLSDQSPLAHSGIAYGDRILWVDGELIFSQKQLVGVLNQPLVLLTVERKGKTFLTRVPRLEVSDLQLSALERAELDDWRYEAGLSTPLHQLTFIPYNLTPEAVVENAMSYIDQESQVKTSFDPGQRASMAAPLQPGDRILAVQGMPIKSSYELLKAVQEKKVLIIAQKVAERKLLPWKEANKAYEAAFEIGDVQNIMSQIGLTQGKIEAGNLRLLNPVTPITLEDFPISPEKQLERQQYLAAQQKAIDKMSDPQVKEQAEKELELYKKRLMIGVSLQDKLVRYNPNPIALFGNVFQETYRTLFALLTGYLSPKNVLGPVGIVQVIHHSWTVGAKEALFWLGMISLNLGILNLLPIPVLDGGHIVLAIVEKCTKKPLKAKTMERLILPFVVLIVALFVYLTYHDISRLVTRFF